MRSSILLGPDCTATFLPIFRKGPDPAQVRAINEGRAAVYVMGRFTYRDAFGKQWKTHWRGPDSGLQAFIIGNAAN